MSQPKALVLVTGVTGFLAQHVCDATLKAGYRVRGTIRDASKSSALMQKYPKNFETTIVADVADSDLTEAMKDVTYVLHTASPYQLTVENGEEELLKPAINGTLNVLKAAKAAGVQKVVITSSFAAITNFKAGGPWRDYTYTGKDWNPTTYEEAAKPGQPGAFVYSASKKLAEEAAFKYAKENDLKIVTLNPPMIYGPAPESAKSAESLNTSSATIYQLFSGKLQAIPDDRLPLFCDVRDVAKAHVLALESSEADGQRVPLCGGKFTWKDAVEELLITHPELKDRLVPLSTAKPAPGPIATIDTSVANSIGLKEFITWKQSLSDTVLSLLALEKKWGISA